MRVRVRGGRSDPAPDAGRGCRGAGVVAGGFQRDLGLQHREQRDALGQRPRIGGRIAVVRRGGRRGKGSPCSPAAPLPSRPRVARRPPAARCRASAAARWWSRRHTKATTTAARFQRGPIRFRACGALCVAHGQPAVVVADGGRGTDAGEKHPAFGKGLGGLHDQLRGWRSGSLAVPRLGRESRRTSERTLRAGGLRIAYGFATWSGGGRGAPRWRAAAVAGVVAGEGRRRSVRRPAKAPVQSGCAPLEAARPPAVGMPTAALTARLTDR